MAESTVSLSAAFTSAYDRRASTAEVAVGRAESFISTFEAQMKSGQSITRESVADARQLAHHLDMTGSALALEGLSGNTPPEMLETNIARVESVADRLNRTLARLG